MPGDTREFSHNVYEHSTELIAIDDEVCGYEIPTLLKVKLTTCPYV